MIDRVRTYYRLKVFHPIGPGKDLSVEARGSYLSFSEIGDL